MQRELTPDAQEQQENANVDESLLNVSIQDTDQSNINIEPDEL